MFTLSGPVKLCVQDGGYSVELKEGKMRLHSQADLNVVVRAFFERVRKIGLAFRKRILGRTGSTKPKYRLTWSALSN